MGKKNSIESSLLSHERALIRSGKLEILESSAVPDQSNSNDDDDFIRLYALKEDDAENHEESDSEYDGNDHDDSSKHENPLARTKCYRTMADAELLHLVARNEMPSTLPFQTIFHGRPGRDYCARRLKENDQNNKNKNVASAYGIAATVVEFDCDENFVGRLFSIQCKVLENEDTAKKQDHDAIILTHSMGFRASRTLGLLNDALKRGDMTWRIIMVKRLKRRQSRHPRL